MNRMVPFFLPVLGILCAVLIYSCVSPQTLTELNRAKDQLQALGSQERALRESEARLLAELDRARTAGESTAAAKAELERLSAAHGKVIVDLNLVKEEKDRLAGEVTILSQKAKEEKKAGWAQAGRISGYFLGSLAPVGTLLGAPAAATLIALVANLLKGRPPVPVVQLTEAKPPTT